MNDAKTDHVPIQPPLAYHDQIFLDGEEARPLRILSEYIRPKAEFERQGVHDTVVFFGSARLTPDGPMGPYLDAARKLAGLVTTWSLKTRAESHRCLVCTGGGGSIMEAANRGAREAGGRTIGLTIGLPHEQRPNDFISQDLNFEFHYFFMRKLWFAHPARAIVAFPGGFGTLDELFEILTLSQTGKLDRSIQVLLFGAAYWTEIINFPALVKHGVIAPDDLDLFRIVDDPAEAMGYLKEVLPAESRPRAPGFARSNTCHRKTYSGDGSRPGSAAGGVRS